MLKLLAVLLCLLATILILGTLLQIERQTRRVPFGPYLRIPQWPLRLAGLAWFLALILALIGLLTGCASPCHPTVDPIQWKRLIEPNPINPWWDLGIGIDCSWRF